MIAVDGMTEHIAVACLLPVRTRQHQPIVINVQKGPSGVLVITVQVILVS